MSEIIKVPIEDFGAGLAEDIFSIQDSLKNTKINEDGLAILLSEASGVRRTDVRAVLRAVPRLSSKYLKEGK